MANTLLAYPYTKSNRTRDKILSEVMMTNLIKILSPVDQFIVSKYGDTMAKEIIIDGYYFYLEEGVGDLTNDLTVYFYTSNEDSNLGESFPELYCAPTDYECLFTSEQNIQNYTQHSAVLSNLPYLDDLRENYVYYLSEYADNTKQGKIWVKIDSEGNVLNPYIYDKDNNIWVPLGAVYKVIN